MSEYKIFIMGYNINGFDLETSLIYSISVSEMFNIETEIKYTSNLAMVIPKNCISTTSYGN